MAIRSNVTIFLMVVLRTPSREGKCMKTAPVPLIRFHRRIPRAIAGGWRKADHMKNIPLSPFPCHSLLNQGGRGCGMRTRRVGR